MAKKSPSQKTKAQVNRFQRWPTKMLLAALEDNKQTLQELKKADPNWRLWGIEQPGPIEQQARHLQDEIEAMELERIRRRTNRAQSATPELTPTQPSVASPFEHSEDFRTLVFQGKTYSLTPRQAHVVQFLFEEREKGMPEVAQDRILVELGSPLTSRLRDTFKGANRDLWGTLIVEGKRRWTRRLNF